MKKDQITGFIEEATRAIDEDKIIFVGLDTAGRQMITLAGREFEGQDALNLQAEAKMILNSQMWPILYETLRKTAQTYMFVQMKTIEDAQYGKALLFNADVIKKILTMVSSKELSTVPPKMGVDRKQ